MIKKEDVIEIRTIIISMENRQKRKEALAAQLLDELEEMNDLIEVLKKEYKILKEKADE